MNCVYVKPAAISAPQYFTKQLQPENICAKLAGIICVRKENREGNSRENLRAALSDVGKLFQLALLISVLEQCTFVNDVYESEISKRFVVLWQKSLTPGSKTK